MRRPGPTSGRSEPAAFVETMQLGAGARTVRTGDGERAGVDALVEVRAALQDGDGDAAERAEDEPPGVAGDAADRGKPGSSAYGMRRRVLHGVGDAAEAGAEDERRAAGRSRRAGVGMRSAAAVTGRRRAAGARRASSGPPDPLGPAEVDRRCRGPANSESRWRQPPHGRDELAASAMTATSAIRVPPSVTSAPIADASAHWPWG